MKHSHFPKKGHAPKPRITSGGTTLRLKGKKPKGGTKGAKN